MTQGSEKIFKRMLEATGAKSVADLARQMGITPEAIYPALKKQKIPPGWLLLIREKTGVSVDWLLTGEGVPFPGRAEPGVGEAEGLWGQTKRQEAEGQTFDITEFEAEAGVGPGPSPAPGLPGDILAELGITLAEFYKLFREYCDIMEKDEVNRVWFFLEMMRRFPYFKDWVKKRRAVDAKEKMGTAEAVGE